MCLASHVWQYVILQAWEMSKNQMSRLYWQICVFFTPFPFLDMGWAYVIKTERKHSNIKWDAIWKILYSWSGKSLTEREMLILPWEKKIRNRKKETSLQWNLILEKHTWVLCIYYVLQDWVLEDGINIESKAYQQVGRDSQEKNWAISI